MLRLQRLNKRNNYDLFLDRFFLLFSSLSNVLGSVKPKILVCTSLYVSRKYWALGTQWEGMSWNIYIRRSSGHCLMNSINRMGWGGVNAEIICMSCSFGLFSVSLFSILKRRSLLWLEKVASYYSLCACMRSIWR